MGYCYNVETLELALLADGDYLMNVGESTDPDEAWTTRIKHIRSGIIVMPIHFRGPYNKAKVYNRNTLVTVFTNVSDLPESDRIEIEWALMNRAY